MGHQSLKIDVFLQYQGITECKHSHIFTYDESTEIWWDKPEEKSGLDEACSFINVNVSQKLADIVLNSSIQADNLLFELMV